MIGEGGKGGRAEGVRAKAPHAKELRAGAATRPGEEREKEEDNAQPGRQVGGYPGKKIEVDGQSDERDETAEEDLWKILRAGKAGCGRVVTW